MCFSKGRNRENVCKKFTTPTQSTLFAPHFGWVYFATIARVWQYGEGGGGSILMSAKTRQQTRARNAVSDAYVRVQAAAARVENFFN